MTNKAETFEENYHSLWSCYDSMRKEKTKIEKQLNIAISFIKGISQTAINDCDNQHVVLNNFKKFAQKALEQINQKDVK